MSESDFDGFIALAWADHADHPDAVAQRLRTHTPEPKTSAQVSALARLVVHLLGEHLGRFDDARWRLTALTTHARADAAAQSTLRVAAATLNLAEGQAAPGVDLDRAETLRAEAGAASICVGRGQTERAMRFIGSARKRLAALSAASADDHRPLAVVCNNMLWELHGRSTRRSAADTAAMLDLAAASREHWFHAGTWVEVERADYGLALAHLAAGLHDDALQHATRCLTACVDHDAPPYEHFFGHEAMARVQHARGDAAAHALHVSAARSMFERLGADEQSDCRAALDAIVALA